MSYNQPEICKISDPVGLEKPIQEIQEALEQLEWLDKSFGRALIFNEGKTKKPKVLQVDGDYYNVLPNDNFVSQSFITVISDEKYLNEFERNQTFKTRDLRITFWGNLKTINKRTEQLKLEVESILKSLYSPKSILNFVDENTEKVFEGFTIEDDKTQYGMYPYFCFRFDLTVIYNDSIC